MTIAWTSISTRSRPTMRYCSSEGSAGRVSITQGNIATPRIHGKVSLTCSRTRA